MPSFARPSRPRVLIVFLIAAAALGAVLLLGHGSPARHLARATCPPGYIKAEREIAARKFGERDASRACISISHPEMPEDVDKFNEAAGRKFGGDSPRAMRAALRQRAHLTDDADVPGANGTWRPLGRGPLVANDPNYPYTYGDAFGVLAGRISDYAYDPNTNRLFATVAQGGVWESLDRGQNWFSISDGPDGLPMQSSGGIAWTPAGGDGGTLVVLTGDHAFSNDYAGLGAYYTTDDGAHWHHAKGIPDGGLSFTVAVDPTDASRLYAATGLGLFRSDDAGRTWDNVDLPTGDCAGDSFKPNCFFANIVTGVAVQPPDKHGHNGGKVAAAVGWRAGQYKNFNGVPQAPANGIYVSDTSAKGSFQKIGDDTGITKTVDFGRTELAAVGSPDQDSEYLYAIVQNATYFTTGVDSDQDVVDCDPVIGGVCANSGSTIDGVYVSHDFGHTWTVMEDHQTFANDASSGSSLTQLRPLGISAGYQTTYNEWIKVDPTQTASDGTPTHLVFGMEEIWQNRFPGQPMNGKTEFETFAPYNQAGACLLVLLAQPCGSTQQANPQGYTTHPDQHGGIMLPGKDGKGVDLIAGNDGGNYVQHSDSGQFSHNWGAGNQNGFQTLLPYGVAMAKDGTVYAGLQDNGEMRIDPKTGVQNEVYGGDAVFNVVNPDKSDEVIEEYPLATLSSSTDGGKSWSNNIAPNVENADFVSPLVQDPLDYKHITTGGRQIVESTKWTDTTGNFCKREPDQDTHPDDPINGCAPADNDWVPVFDLGTYKHPGDPKAGRSSEGDETSDSVDTADDPVNVDVAQALYGAAHYVGFCGSCDPVKLHEPFHTGIATNVGGDKPPKVASADGWHVAKAQGLPNRIITSITIDPKDTNTIYVTLGQSATRPFAPLGSLGDDASSAKGGFVYVSHDHGDSFQDVTGDLPKVQGSWIRLKGNQMVVANAIGMFISSDLTGKHWAELGQGFPTSPVYSFEFEPQDPEKMVVASYGRGVWEYDFRKRQGAAVLDQQVAGARPKCGDRTGPTSRFLSRLSKAVRRSRKGLVLRGTSSFRKCKSSAAGKVKRVVVTLKLQQGKRCRYLNKKGRLGPFTSCKKRARLFTAKGTRKWSFKISGPLPPGKYLALVLAKDDIGNTERRTKHRNFRHFRLSGRAVIAGWHGRQSGKVPPPGHK